VGKSRQRHPSLFHAPCFIITGKENGFVFVIVFLLLRSLFRLSMTPFAIG
jgi:hypothetical protein